MTRSMKSTPSNASSPMDTTGNPENLAGKIIVGITVSEEKSIEARV